ncbi:polysaccharide biosynthesis/export family protein [Stagnihabitans tardus]|uniref:Polysaccharide export protein n=1 Tax=Stagnihabitans tardus TaxID=2699202 RepID=A0AAE4YCS5_9RHOB|nr:polysaccharide biosynthesis/export family protein [Stagnihabitans tardus]NBZ89664.1 polysaccharide export protein [Stagnihabitans tardus]
MPFLFRSLWTALVLTMLAALAPAFAQDGGYKIQPGDTLQMDVLEDSSLSRPLLVLPDGTVSVPSGGVVRAAGLSLPQVQEAVTAALAPNFAKTPTVYLSVGQLSPDTPKPGAGAAAGTTVYLMGEVAKPGSVAVPKGTTLLQFLAETGGLSPYAATKRIQIRRMVNGEEKLWIFNYAAVMAGGPAPAITLQKGDVIIVPQRRLFE